MAQVVKLKRTAVEGKVPSTSNLELGELAINTYDGRIFFEKDNGASSIEQIVTTNSQTTGSINIIGNVTASIFFGNIQSTNGVVSGSSQLTASFDTRYLNTSGDGVVSGSSQITYSGISSIPAGIISGSSQLTASYDTRYLNTLGDGVVSGSSQVVGILTSLNSYTASNNTTNTTQNTRLDQLSTASGSAIGRLNNLELISASLLGETLNLELYTASNDTKWSILQSITSSLITATSSYELRGTGIISGSSQLTASFDTRYLNTLGDGVISGSSQVVYTSLSSIPVGIVSGSSQVVGILGSLNSYTASNDTTNTTQNSRLTSLETASGSAISRLNTLEVETANLEAFTGSINTTIKDQLNANTVISGSSQVVYTSLSSIPAGIVSGSSQVNADLITNFDSNVKEKLDADGVLSGSVINGNKTFSNDVTISGNLTVNGTTTTVNSNTVNIGDNILILNSDETGTPSQNGGIEIERGTSTNASLIWNESIDQWQAGLSGSEVSLVDVSSTQSLFNKTINGGNNTISNIGNSSLTNSSISGSSQITYSGISSIPVGIVSGSAQVTPLLPTGVVSGSSQVISILSSLNTYTGSNNTTNTTQNNRLTSLETASGSAITRLTALEVETANLEAFTGSINTTIKGQLNANTVVSGSSQVSYIGLSNIPAGIVSGSSQITSLLPTGVVSGSSQVINSLVSQSVNLGTGAITASFFKGDGSQLTNLPAADVSQVATVTSSFDNQSTISVTHNFNTKNVIISVYENNDTQIIPSSITLTNNNTATIVLSANHSGYIVVAKGGHIVSGSATDSSALNGQPGSYYLDYTNFTNIPSGIVSGSTQITNLTTYAVNVSGNSTYTITHNLNEEYPIVQAWNTSTKRQELPSIIESTSANALDVTFSGNFSGRIIVKK